MSILDPDVVLPLYRAHFGDVWYPRNTNYGEIDGMTTSGTFVVNRFGTTPDGLDVTRTPMSSHDTLLAAVQSLVGTPAWLTAEWLDANTEQITLPPY